MQGEGRVVSCGGGLFRYKINPAQLISSSHSILSSNVYLLLCTGLLCHPFLHSFHILNFLIPFISFLFMCFCYKFKLVATFNNMYNND